MLIALLAAAACVLLCDERAGSAAASRARPSATQPAASRARPSATQPAAPRPFESAPAQPAATRPFQPGVALDWGARAVHLSSHVVLRDGDLELLACFHSKEHESILRIDADPEHVFQALGLLGLVAAPDARCSDNSTTPDNNAPPHPSGAGDRASATAQPGLPPSHALVDVELHWTADGAARRAAAADWLRRTDSGVTPVARPWLLAARPQRTAGVLSCARSGVAIAVVDFPDGLVAYPRPASDDSTNLWCQANGPAIPPVGAAVDVVIAPARPREYAITLDFRGGVSINGRRCDAADAANVVLLARRIEPERVFEIGVERALRSDGAALRAKLIAAGVPRAALK